MSKLAGQSLGTCVLADDCRAARLMFAFDDKRGDDRGANSRNLVLNPTAGFAGPYFCGPMTCGQPV